MSNQERLRTAKSEADYLLVDNTLAKRLFGWQPEVSLEEVLKRTIESTSSTLHGISVPATRIDLIQKLRCSIRSRL